MLPNHSKDNELKVYKYDSKQRKDQITLKKAKENRKKDQMKTNGRYQEFTKNYKK